MKWFKHYNNSFDGQSMELLLAEGDYECITFYWWILEQISKFEDPKVRGKCELSFAYLRRKLGWNRSRSSRVLGKIGSRTGLEFTLKDESDCIEVFHPKWLKLQETGKKNTEKSEKKGDKNENDFQSLDLRVKKEDLRVKKKEEEVSDFFRILNESEFHSTTLQKALEIESIEKFLKSQNAFGQTETPLFKKTKLKFLATLAHVYGSAEDLRLDLTSIINEKTTDEKAGVSKADYITTRLKNKTLELYNATR